jgi:nicotinamidase-related amidase
MFDFAGPVEDFNFKGGTKEVEFSEGLERPKNAVELVKKRYSAFAGTDLDQTLKKIDAGRVVICGFMTNFCCDSTARDAHDLDYFVDFITDATGTPGTAHMNQGKIREVVASLLGEGYAEVFSTKDYLKKLLSRSK